MTEITLLLCVGFLPAGAFAAKSEPFELAAPENLFVELKSDQNNWPYFAISLDVPSAVREINDNLNDDFNYYSDANCLPIGIRFDSKYGDYDWNEGPSLYTLNTMAVNDILSGNVYKYYPYEEKNANGG